MYIYTQFSGDCRDREDAMYIIYVYTRSLNVLLVLYIYERKREREGGIFLYSAIVGGYSGGREMRPTARDSHICQASLFVNIKFWRRLAFLEILVQGEV